MFVGHETEEKWLLVSQNSSALQIHSVYLPVNNMITVATFSPERDTATLFEVYQVSAELDQRIVRVGRWAAKEEHSGNIGKQDLEGNADREVKELEYGVLEAPVSDPLLRRRDLTGLHLRCTTIMYDPLTTLRAEPDGRIFVDGLYGKVFQTLQEVTNFTYTCHRVKDGQWGSLVDGKWTGMIKELDEGEADIAVAPLSITPLRSTASDFLYGLAVSGFRIAMKRPSNEDYMWSVYTKQFHPWVWAAMAVVGASLATSLYLASRWSSRLVSLPESAFVVVGIIFGQGTTFVIKTLAGRTLLLTAMFLQVVVLGFYTSNLVSALTVGPPMPALENLQDVFDDKSITFGFLKGSSLTDRFNSPTPLYQAVLRRMKEEDFVMSPEEGMERLLRGNYAFMEWEFYYNLNFGGECGAFLLPASYFPDYTSFALSKGSPLVALFNTIVLDIQSVGLMRKWLRELKVESNCALLETAPIDLKTVLTPFLLVALSILFSVAICGAEMYIKSSCSSSGFQLDINTTSPKKPTDDS